MNVITTQHEDPDLRAMFEAGEDVSYAGETLSFSEGNRELVFHIDALSPNEALFQSVVTGGVSQRPKLGPAFGSSAVQVEKGDGLLSQAICYLVEHRKVEEVAIYDGPSGFFRRVPVHELA